MKNYYAGIGSRDTPKQTQKVMEAVGTYLAMEGWVLRSGAADGADNAFEVGAIRGNGETEIYLPWANFNSHKSDLNPSIHPFSEEEKTFTARFHPAWSKCSPSAKLLHTRNTRQVLGCEQVHGEQVQPVKFIVCWTQDGKMVGGTSQALRIAKSLGIKIINFGSAKNADELEAMVISIEKEVGKYK